VRDNWESGGTQAIKLHTQHGTETQGGHRNWGQDAVEARRCNVNSDSTPVDHRLPIPVGGRGSETPEWLHRTSFVYTCLRSLILTVLPLTVPHTRVRIVVHLLVFWPGSMDCTHNNGFNTSPQSKLGM